jgi:hypothetical protein
MFAYKIISDFSPTINNDVNMNNESKAVFNEVNNRMPNIIEGIFMFLFIGLWVAVLVAAFVSDSHPLLFIFMFILLIFVIIASVMFGNFFEEFFNDSTFSGLTDKFMLSYWIMTHMLPISIGIGISSLLVWYGKNRY